MSKRFRRKRVSGKAKYTLDRLGGESVLDSAAFISLTGSKMVWNV